MFPIRDNIPSKKLPFLTYTLAAVNAAVFLHELGLGRALEPFIYRYGIVPALWGSGARPFELWTPIVTSMFLHGGWLHILSNLWMLLIFGHGVESRLGPLRYLAFYLFCGVAAGALHIATQWGSMVPTIGASGAIAGVMGAYLVLYPRAKIVTVVPVFIFLHFAQVPAWLFLGFWFLMQLYSGTLAVAAEFSGIAWWAHIGGFLAGVYWVLRFKGKGARRGKR